MTRTTWEYSTIQFDVGGFLTPKLDSAAFDAELDRMGRDGWELVSVLDLNWGNGASWRLVGVFKRPR